MDGGAEPDVPVLPEPADVVVLDDEREEPPQPVMVAKRKNAKGKTRVRDISGLP